MKLSYEEFKQELEDHGYLDILWHKDDIISVLKENEYPHDDEVVDEIAKNIEKYHDCQYGINWDSIEGSVHEYFQKQREEKSTGT
jgi:hypothetical protein